MANLSFNEEHQRRARAASLGDLPADPEVMGLDTFYDRVQDKLADDEGLMTEDHGRYEVYGVWMDGNPQLLASGLTYAQAVEEYDRLQATKQLRVGNVGDMIALAVAPFYGIQDPEDPERGWGPWDVDFPPQ
jgi:hypothetical protein